MKRRRLWCVALISGLGVLLLTGAKPAGERFARPLRWENVNQTCRSGDCNDEVNRDQLRVIESYMNLTADPCENFHSYACGNWQREHPHGTTMMTIANNEVTARYQALFEGWVRAKKISEDAHKARRACAAQNCLPERKALAEIQEISGESFVPSAACKENCVTEPMQLTSLSHSQLLMNPIVQKLLQYYEVCKGKTDNSLRPYFELVRPRLNLHSHNFSWLDTLAELGRFGYSGHFLSMDVVQVNSSLHRVVIYPHDAEFRVELKSDTFQILSAFTNYNQSVLQQRFSELETSLFQSSCRYCADVGEYFEPDCDCYEIEVMTFATLNAQLPEVDWQRYLSPQLGRRVEANEILEVVNLELIKVQVRLIEQIDVELQLLYTTARFLDYLKKEQEQLQKHETTELNCLHHMRKLFALPMTYVYEQAIYSSIRAKSEPVVQQIFEELKVQFALTIQSNKMQFSPTILSQLQSKLTNLRINVSNFPKNVSLQFFTDFIAPYSFSNDFHSNHLHALEVVYKQSNSLLDVSASKLQHTWHSFNLHLPHFTDNLEATPYYYARSNLVVLTYSYLQMPFFDASFWPALLYGDLANTLGHEMMHAFDTEFLQFDAHGNPSEELLKNMLTNSNFCRNFDCLKQGTDFVRERLADVSGTRLALNAFLNSDPRALERNGELYFLQFAQFFCGSADAATFQQEDPLHDGDSSRLNYVLGVMPEFAEVFKCPAGSGMNPVAKCEMYR